LLLITTVDVWESRDGNFATLYLFLKEDLEKTGAAARIAGKALELKEKIIWREEAASNQTFSGEAILVGLMMLPYPNLAKITYRGVSPGHRASPILSVNGRSPPNRHNAGIKPQVRSNFHIPASFSLCNKRDMLKNRR